MEKLTQGIFWGGGRQTKISKNKRGQTVKEEVEGGLRYFQGRGGGGTTIIKGVPQLPPLHQPKKNNM